MRSTMLDAIPSQSEVAINAIGSASVYATLLAIDLQRKQIPMKSIVVFGATRFTDQKSHNAISTTFGKKMMNFTHEYDMNYKINTWF